MPEKKEDISEEQAANSDEQTVSEENKSNLRTPSL